MEAPDTSMLANAERVRKTSYCGSNFIRVDSVAERLGSEIQRNENSALAAC